MPENEFEKKVSSEMQELKFAPSEKVWLHVEERIRKKNKRRVFVIIFLLAGLALLGYWQRDNLFGEKKNDIVKNEKQKEGNSQPSEETKNSPTTIQNTESTGATKQNEPKNLKDIDENKETVQDTNTKTVSEKLLDEKPPVNKKSIEVPGNKTVPPRNKEKSIPKPLKNETEIQPSQPVTPEVTDINANIPPKKDSVSKVQDEVGQKQQPDIKQPEQKPNENNPDSIKNGIIQPKKNNIEIKDSASKTRLLKDSAAVVQKKPGNKKWKWGLQFTPGISTLNQNNFSLSDKRAEALNYQSPSTGAGIPPVRRRPSEVRPGFAFQLGGFGQTTISSRNRLSIGLQYGFYSNHLDIGNRRDSLLRNNQLSNFADANTVYNAGSDTVTYTNRYHFIELPLQFHWQLNKNTTKPFVWSAGFTLGQLITSNAIMYDTAFGGIYYKNKNLLKKTQFSLSTGFSWTIANNKRTQWRLGPFADIHLNRLVDNPFEGKKYMHFFGMRTAVIVNQKK